MTDEAEVTRLKAEIASLRAEKALTLKVSPKGAVSVYGLQRFPVTLYAEQWTKLLDEGGKIRAFIEANMSDLKWRGT